MIVELAIPDPEVEYVEVSRHGENIRLPVSIAPQTEQEHAQLDKVSRDAQQFLEDLLTEPPVYLQAARAFIARATGKELDLIARRPFTKRIELNRRLPS